MNITRHRQFQRHFFESERLPVTEVYELGVENPVDVSDKEYTAIIRASLDFYDEANRKFVPDDLSVVLHEAFFSDKFFPFGRFAINARNFTIHDSTALIGNIDDRDLRQEVKNTLELAVPGSMVDGSLVVYTDLPGFRMFNNRYDRKRTWEDHILDFAGKVSIH